MIVTAAEQVRYTPAPRGRGRWGSGGGTLTPDGRVHAYEDGHTLCDAGDDIVRIFFDLPWGQAKSYDRCADCINLVRSRAA